MKIYKRAFETYPTEMQTALRAASVEAESWFEIPAADFLRITAPKSAIRNPQSAIQATHGDLDSALDAEIKRATGQTPCKGCGR